MNIEYIHNRELIIFKCISGSKSYGLDTPSSDTDIKGVYVLPEDEFFGLNYIGQINDANNDEVYYELKRFIELLAQNNPNLLEMLYMPQEFILHKHPLFDKIKPDLFLSRLCEKSFAGYAITQIKKARSLNKKILNTMSKERKGVLSFCYVAADGHSMPLINWLEKEQIPQSECGLTNLSHMSNTYALYHQAAKKHQYNGIVKDMDANDVCLSSIEKGEKPVAIMTFNKNGYSTYCKSYKEYWEWVSKRNETRYQNTLSHGKNYDAKNMMHTFRLLDMAEEIARLGRVVVKRENRDYYLSIRAGEFQYEELIELAEQKVNNIKRLYEKSTLPMRPDLNQINHMLVDLRKSIYQNGI